MKKALALILSITDTHAQYSKYIYSDIYPSFMVKIFNIFQLLNMNSTLSLSCLSIPSMPWSTFTTPASFPSLCKPPFYSQRLIRWTYLQSICDWIHVLLLLCLAYSTKYNYLQVNTHWQKCQEFILYCGGDNIPLYVLTILHLSTYQLMNPVVCL